MLDNVANIIRVSALSRVKDEDKAKDKASREVSTNIRARMEAEQLERDREEFYSRASVEPNRKEENKRTRKVREAKVKIEADYAEGVRLWDKAEDKARVKAEIARISAKVSKSSNVKAEVRLVESSDAARQKTEEAGAQIRSREEANTEKRERAWDEARARAEANIREKRKG